ncbi:unnamed protein product [Urochloa decumbens]|uniref:BURP domain-containing protein n=1 Tax=Urochloa decumbens TaxID=240449 RepID=A0ABC9BRK7_9POAL
MAVFFREDTLRVGQNLSIRFPTPVAAPLGFLPRHIADAIPFSSATLPTVLAQLGVPKNSIQAAKMEDALAMCEAPGLAWEAKFCATSLEALVEGVQGVLGTRAVTEMVSSRVPHGSPRLQVYAVRAVRTIEGSGFVGCHQIEYPYTLYMCHSTGPARAYDVDMVDIVDGNNVTVPAVCHTDTSEWDEDHVAFRLLGTKPGGPPVCHVLPYGNILWAKKNASLSSSSA